MSTSRLFHAVRKGDLQEVERSIRSGAKVGNREANGKTSIMLAVELRHKHIAEYLVKKTSTESLNLSDRGGDNVLHYIARYAWNLHELWTDVCNKCPGLDQERNNRNERPVDLVRNNQNRSSRHRELYLHIEGYSQENYKRGICETYENAYSLTVTCIGHEGVGKTCLVKNLKEEEIPKGGPPSTNLANFYPNHLLFDPKTGTREKMKDGGQTETGLRRLRYAFEQYQKKQSTEEEGHTSPLDETDGELETDHLYDASFLEGHTDIQDYKQMTKWRKQCTKKGLDQWFSKQVDEKTSKEKLKIIRKFKALYGLYLRQSANCSNCTTTLLDTSNTKYMKTWLRCLQCCDTNLCSECYESGVKLENGHTDDHDMFPVKHGTICHHCKALTVGTSIFCNKCDIFLCYGCHLHTKFLSRHKSSHHHTDIATGTLPGRKTSAEQAETANEVLDAVPEDDDGAPKGYVTIYDFGGEKVFYNTHHCILSGDMVFLLVFDVAMCLDPVRAKAGFERIEFWLESISIYAIDNEETDNGIPPILLIGSHMDQVNGTEEEKIQQFEEVIKKLEEVPRLKLIIDKHVKGRYHISHMNDSSKNRDIFIRIWNNIMDVAHLQSQWGKLVPARWINLEIEITKHREKGCSIMTFDEIKDLNRKLIVPLADESDIRNFLEHVNVRGDILVFNLVTEAPFVILNFNLIAQAFNSIITEEKFKTNLRPDEMLQWRTYEKCGKLPEDLLKKLWKKEQIQGLAGKEEILCYAMELLGLLCKPLSDTDDIDFYIVPSMLENANPSWVQPVLERSNICRTKPLCIKFENMFIPQAIWDKTLAGCMHRFGPYQEPDSNSCCFIQRNFACLKVDGRWNMVLYCMKNVMKLVIFRENDDKDPNLDNLIPPGTGVHVRELIDYLLQHVLTISNQSHLKYDYFIQSDYRLSDDQNMVMINELNTYLHVPEEHSSVNQTDGDVWFFEKEEVRNHNLSPGYVNVGIALPDRKPTHSELGRICKFIGDSYQIFFVDLDCSIEEIEQSMIEYHHLSVRSRLTRLFIKHLNKVGRISYSTIYLAMKDHGLNMDILPDLLDGNQQHGQIGVAALSEEVLRRIPNQKEVKIFKEYIDNSYFNLFLELGLEANHIGHCEVNHRGRDCRNLFEALLKQWIVQMKTDATINRLLLAMQDCGMSWVEVSEKLAI